MKQLIRPAIVAAVLLASGCAPSRANPATVTIPLGPGPQAHYTVQPQPAAGSCRAGASASGQPLPDRACTPGALSPAVTQETLGTTICVRGYTATIRPPQSVTGREKRANAKSYGYTGFLGDAEYDHLVSLELGGDPNDPRNLWVEPPSPGHVSGTGVLNPKDRVEGDLKRAVCSGRVKLTVAQIAITVDWTTAEKVLGLAN